MVDEIALTISVVSILFTVIGFLIEHFKIQAGMHERIATLEAKQKNIDDHAKRLDDFSRRFDDWGERIKALEVKMELFWDAVSSNVITMLKHPTAERRDELLDRLGDKSITLAEMEELKRILTCNVKLKSRESLAAAVVVARINQKLYDAGRLVVPTKT